MPLLMCPNDNSPMQTLDRAGVQFDMCPACRGVWLDRGELEKLMESAAADGRASAVQAQPAPQPQQTYAPPQGSPWGHRDDRPRDSYRGDDDRHYKKKKRDSIFDIFD